MKMEVVITDNKIIIKKYPLNNFWCKKRIIYNNEIDFIKLDTDIISLCINSQEILFIPKSYKDQLQKFIKKYNIKISDNVDVWRLICYPFVDEYITEESLVENMSQLKNLSFEQEEVELIRKRISTLIRWWLTFTMENSSLIHCDIIQARKNIYFFNPFYSRFYWYTMKIALRGFGIKIKT